MTLETVPLSSLLPPKGNPRRVLDAALIEGLAESIRADGLLQNLVVRPDAEDKYRVIAGHRRLLALRLLAKRKAIDRRYPVSVEIKGELSADDAVRLATVENIQREDLNPVDEADAFAALVRNGTSFEDVAARAGVPKQRVRRRLALVGLAPEAKKALRAGMITLAVAESLTLGATAREQRRALAMIEDGTLADAEDVRRMLIEDKPSVATAIFPLDRYTGTYTRDLFGEAETTYFDDVEQFRTLQRTAVDALAERYRATAAWVEVVRGYVAPWWQYCAADEEQSSGVVIHVAPNGGVEVREGLVRCIVAERVREESGQTHHAAVAPRRPRPEYSTFLARYIGAHKTVAVQASLLVERRRAKEVAVVLLLQGSEKYGLGARVQIAPHPALAFFAGAEEKPRAYEALAREVRRLAELLRMDAAEEAAVHESRDGTEVIAEQLFQSGQDAISLYEALRRLDDGELDALLCLVLVLCFGQESLDVLDSEESFFNRIALDLQVDMRAFWRPDETFLHGRTREQLVAIAVESGAEANRGRLRTYSKRELVNMLVRYFKRTANLETAAPQTADAKGREWLPGAMEFPARTAAAANTPAA